VPLGLTSTHTERQTDRQLLIYYTISSASRARNAQNYFTPFELKLKNIVVEQNSGM